MPFTLAHAAAALPFRLTRLNKSALIVGTFAPDFEYFLRLAPRSGFGHTLFGVFVLTLPLALLILWLFRHVVKAPAISLLPDSIQHRLSESPKDSPLTRAALASVVLSALIGIFTHILWDSFTHPNTWPYRHWPLLSQTLRVPIAGSIANYKLLQHASTVTGICILAAWLLHWYHATEPRAQPANRSISWKRRLVIIGVALTVASLGSLIRVMSQVMIGTSPSSHSVEGIAGEAICTFIALLWWQLAAYGLLSLTRHPSPSKDQYESIGR